MVSLDVILGLGTAWVGTATTMKTKAILASTIAILLSVLFTGLATVPAAARAQVNHVIQEIQAFTPVR